MHIARRGHTGPTAVDMANTTDDVDVDDGIDTSVVWQVNASWLCGTAGPFWNLAGAVGLPPETPHNKTYGPNLNKRVNIFFFQPTKPNYLISKLPTKNPKPSTK